MSFDILRKQVNTLYSKGDLKNATLKVIDAYDQYNVDFQDSIDINDYDFTDVVKHILGDKIRKESKDVNEFTTDINDLKNDVVTFDKLINVDSIILDTSLGIWNFRIIDNDDLNEIIDILESKVNK